MGTMSFRYRPGVQRCAVTVMVSSVGPYRFSRVAPGAAAAQSSASLQLSASPAKKLHRSDGSAPGPSPPVRRTRVIALGVENHTVIRCSATNSGRCAYARAGTGTTAAPAPQAQNRSNIAQSKLRSKVWEKTSCGPKS